MSAITNFVISIFRIHGVTRYKEETRRALQLLALSPG